MSDIPIIADEKRTLIGYRVTTFDASSGLWFYSDQTTEERARIEFKYRNSIGKPTKLERVTQTVEIIGQPTFEPE